MSLISYAHLIAIKPPWLAAAITVKKKKLPHFEFRHFGAHDVPWIQLQNERNTLQHKGRKFTCSQKSRNNISIYDAVGQYAQVQGNKETDKR
jgi:hypothetical protein